MPTPDTLRAAAEAAVDAFFVSDTNPRALRSAMARLAAELEPAPAPPIRAVAEVTGELGNELPRLVHR